MSTVDLLWFINLVWAVFNAWFSYRNMTAARRNAENAASLLLAGEELGALLLTHAKSQGEG